jgi:hypothetical protein
VTERNGKDDDIPRQSFFELLPKRSIAKIVVLIAMLVGIVVLQRRAGFVAGCAQSTFVAPSTRSGTAPRVRIESPATPSPR